MPEEWIAHCLNVSLSDNQILDRQELKTPKITKTPEKVVYSNLRGNINNIRALLAHLLYHVKLFSAYHIYLLYGVALKETICRIKNKAMNITIIKTPGSTINIPLPFHSICHFFSSKNNVFFVS